MIDLKELNNFITKVNETELNSDNYKDFFDYSIKVCKDYDIKSINGTNDKSLMLQELKYIEIFYHKLCNMLYGLNTKYEFKSDGKNNYSPQTDTIYYRFGAMMDLLSNSAYHIMTIFHENRHAMQFKEMLHNTDVLTMDPSAIVFAKELLSTDDEIYRKNHSSFMVENDANLFAYGYVREIVKQHFPENIETINMRIKGENHNIATELFNDFIDSEEVYKNPPESNLPILYYIDINSKRVVNKELIKNYQVLSLIYNTDGTIKNYSQIINERKVQLEKVTNMQMKFKRSSHSYNDDEFLTQVDKVNLVYNTIINSDPTLFIEDCIYNRNYDKLIKEVNDYPRLFKLYKTDFLSIIPKYMTIENVKEFKRLSTNINSEELKSVLDKKFEYIIKKEIRNISGMTIDNEDETGELKETNVLNQEYEYLSSLLKEKNKNKTLSSEKYNTLMKYINSTYKGFIVNSQQENMLNSSENDLEDSYLFDDPVYLQLFKRYNMQEASEEEQGIFAEKYESEKEKIGDSKFENIESTDKVEPRKIL